MNVLVPDFNWHWTKQLFLLKKDFKDSCICPGGLDWVWLIFESTTPVPSNRFRLRHFRSDCAAFIRQDDKWEVTDHRLKKKNNVLSRVNCLLSWNKNYVVMIFTGDDRNCKLSLPDFNIAGVYRRWFPLHNDKRLWRVAGVGHGSGLQLSQSQRMPAAAATTTPTATTLSILIKKHIHILSLVL